jgi:hypothetical protein
MKMYGGVEVQLHSFLTSTLDGREQSYSRPDHFVSEKNPISHGMEGRLGPIAGFDTLEKRKISFGWNRTKIWI